MKRLTTLLCSLAFLIGGIAISSIKSPPPDVGIPTSRAYAQSVNFGFENYRTVEKTVIKTDTVVVPTSITVQADNKRRKTRTVVRTVEKRDTTFVPVYCIIVPDKDANTSVVDSLNTF